MQDSSKTSPRSPKEPVKKAAAAAGIGDRSQMPTIIAGAGPHVRVMPVSKAMDYNGGQPSPQATMTPAEINSAVVNQDQESVLKLMKGARPLADVPNTLVPALSKLH